MESRGNYIAGQFVPASGVEFHSTNPATENDVVWVGHEDVAHCHDAAGAAQEAHGAWARRSFGERWELLMQFRAQIEEKREEIAQAIVLETGKIRTEARTEVQGVINRFSLMHQLISEKYRDGSVPGFPNEQLRFRPLGVVGVVGPFNFPVHLIHAYVVPSLLLGNTVVVKPSEVTPGCGQIYAECAHAAGLPPGVFNLVQGGGAVGAALVENSAVRGLCFTGSYPTGKKITAAAIERPELLLSLEMGGKNTCIVMDDAHMRQAVHEIVIGGYLTTGQRCTGTDRVLVHRDVADEFLAYLRTAVENLQFGDPDDGRSFAGPMVSVESRSRFEKALNAAITAGAEPFLAGDSPSGGAYRTGSIHVLPRGNDAPGYLDEETFGPDLGIQIFHDDDEAVSLLNKSAYGFANSVFTRSQTRFEYLFQQTHSGILNLNRSTNLASPRLPFGGVGKSGNYRPAGAYTPRNVSVPMAVQKNTWGAVTPHDALRGSLPPINLEQLAEQHAREESDEASRLMLGNPRPVGMKLPKDGQLPQSRQWLERLYAADRMAKEKKPLVFDHLRSSGPWMVSVDENPMSVLDGMSQTATLCGGFAEDRVVQGFVEGEFDGTLTWSDWRTDAAEAAAEDFARVLHHELPGLDEVAFVNSGAEANEKALGLCFDNCERKDATKILAFEGGFHGRTLTALHATYNPAKREPFLLPQFPATFAPFPVWRRPRKKQPTAPAGFYAAAAHGDISELERYNSPHEDPLLAAEAQSLIACSEALQTGEYYACIVEPMQSEGGDRYATDRFFRALRLLTRHFQTYLILDEVQCGFGLSGPFVWHSQFRLFDSKGRPDVPDAVTFAKRAQLGVVVSRFVDPEETPCHPASLVRGRIHGEMMRTVRSGERIASLVKKRLERIAQSFPHLVIDPRSRGYAFAFDLPNKEMVDRYLKQRFWRGAVVFAAGERTIRYRLSESFLLREIDMLFLTIRRTLAWLDAHPGMDAPSWENGAPAPSLRELPDFRIRSVDVQEALELLPAILDIEFQVYEPARRTPPAEIRAALEDPQATRTIVEIQKGQGPWQMAGFGIGAPLEHCEDVEGPDRDPMLGRNNTLYSVSVTVAPGYQGLGLGRKIKHAQLREAAKMLREDGTPRYSYVSGRNRIGMTASMTHLNRVFGAHVVCVMTGQYEDPEGQAIYYRIPLGPLRPDPVLSVAPKVVPRLDSVCDPFALPPESLRKSVSNGQIYGPTVNKITLLNYATPAMVRAVEWVSALVPELPHLYLSSGRDEAFDKTLRLFRWHRPNARVAIGLEGGYVGHTVGSARALSDPGVHFGCRSPFHWPRIPFVNKATELVAELDKAVSAAGGPDQVLGFYYEAIQERTGRVLSDSVREGIHKWGKERGVPVCAVETAAGGYRGQAAAFSWNGLSTTPDVGLWWGGGQTGYVFVSDALWVNKPMTFVSTWDGDELTLLRHHHQLRALRKLDLAKIHQEVAGYMDALKGTGDVYGQGAYWGYRPNEAVRERLEASDIEFAEFANGVIPVVPTFDEYRSQLETLLKVTRAR